MYPAPHGVSFEKEIIWKKKKYNTNPIHIKYREIGIIFNLLLILIFINFLLSAYWLYSFTASTNALAWSTGMFGKIPWPRFTM